MPSVVRWPMGGGSTSQVLINTSKTTPLPHMCSEYLVVGKPKDAAVASLVFSGAIMLAIGGVVQTRMDERASNPDRSEDRWESIHGRLTDFLD